MLSPPVDVNATGGKIGYAISKFGMTLIAHGLADEVRDDNVAANALWPATMIESLATINWGLEGVTDFVPYRCDPAHEPPRLGFDFKIPKG